MRFQALAHALLAMALHGCGATVIRGSGGGGSADASGGAGGSADAVAATPSPPSAAVYGQAWRPWRLLALVADHVELPAGASALGLAGGGLWQDLLIFDRLPAAPVTPPPLPKTTGVFAQVGETLVALPWATITSAITSALDDADLHHAAVRARVAGCADAACPATFWTAAIDDRGVIAVDPDRAWPAPIGTSLDRPTLATLVARALGLPDDGVDASSWSSASSASFVRRGTSETVDLAKAWPDLRPEARAVLLAADALPPGFGGALEWVDASVAPLADDFLVGLRYRVDAGCGAVATELYVVDGDLRRGAVRVGDGPSVGSGCSEQRPLGRIPAGMAPLDRGQPGDVRASYYARAIQLEAASVAAFERLARELAQLGAPAALVRRAQAAAIDEARHATQMRALGAPLGVVVAPPRVDDVGARSAAQIAHENAIEGCVREGHAALIAALQARRAGDAAVAATMQAIADDEAAHAQLAWDVDAWLRPRLPPDVQRAIAAAARAAAGALAAGDERLPAEGLLADDVEAQLARAYAEHCRAAFA